MGLPHVGGGASSFGGPHSAPRVTSPRALKLENLRGDLGQSLCTPTLPRSLSPLHLDSAQVPVTPQPPPRSLSPPNLDSDIPGLPPASLLGPEPLVAAPAPARMHRELLLSFPFSLTQSALFPIRGVCILNVSAVSVSAATVPLLPHPPTFFPKSDTRVGSINLQLLARYQMYWVEANCHRKCNFR